MDDSSLASIPPPLAPESLPSPRRRQWPTRSDHTRHATRNPAARVWRDPLACVRRLSYEMPVRTTILISTTTGTTATATTTIISTMNETTVTVSSCVQVASSCVQVASSCIKLRASCVHQYCLAALAALMRFCKHTSTFMFFYFSLATLKRFCQHTSTFMFFISARQHARDAASI